MRSSIALCTLVLSWVIPAGAQSAGETPIETPAITVDEVVEVALQQVYATVIDRRGRRVTSLGRDDFTVRDADAEQEIVTFAAGDIPFTAVLLIDASLSMAGARLDAALAAARGFVAGMRGHDQAQVVAFADRVLGATSIGDRESLGAEIADPEAGGSTAIRDHLFVALRQLEARQGRRAVVLLTDGWDRVSVLDPETLRAAAKRSQSVIYWVRLAGDEPTSFQHRARPRAIRGAFEAIRYHPAPSSWQEEEEARRAYRELERLVPLTGGRVVTAEGVGGMPAAVRDVLDELHQQYAIGYYPRGETPADGWRPVRIEVRGRGLVARTREGYVER